MKRNLKMNWLQQSNKVLALSLIMLMLTGGLFAQKIWSLEECIYYALDHNITIKKSELGSRMSEIDLLQSKLNFAPSINANSSYTTYWGRYADPINLVIIDTKSKRAQFGLNSSLTLFNGFQKYNTLKKAQLDYIASKYDADKIRDDIALAVAINYLNVLFNMELVDKSSAQLDVTQIQLYNTEKFVAAGTMPKGNLLEIQSQKAIEEVTLINAENQLNLAYLDLVQLLELEGDTDFAISRPNLGIENASNLLPAQTVYGTALMRLPQIKSSELKLESALKGISIARGGRSPRITANAGWSTSYSDQDFIRDEFGVPSTNLISFSDQFNNNINKYFGFSINVPVFNGFQVSSNINRSKAGALNAEYDLDLQKNTVRKSIEQAYSDAIAAYKSYNANIKAVAASKEAFKYMEQKFNVGMENSLNYNIAKVQMIKAESDLISAKYNYIFKTKILDFYQGNPLSLNGN